MGILRQLFDNEWTQRHDIDQIHNRVVRHSTVGRLHQSQLRERIALLENDNAELALLVRGLFVYLKRRPDFDAAMFATIIKEIDARDGVIDGKVTKRKAKLDKPTTTKPLVQRRR